MKTEDGYKVVLRSYAEPGISKEDRYLSSTIGISCKHYSTFKAIVDAVIPILEKEESDLND